MLTLNTFQQMIAKGLVLHARCNEGIGTVINDISNGNNQGNLISSPTWVKGIRGNAINLNGSSQYINYTSNNLLSLDNHDKSFCVWIKLNALTQNSIIDKDFDNGGTNHGGWGFWMQSTGQLWWWADGGLDLKDNGSMSIPLNIWTHVAVTWSNSLLTASFYINGILNSSLTNLSIVEQASGSAILNIGSFRSGTGSFVNGAIQSVRAYNYVISQSLIKALYNQKV